MGGLGAAERQGMIGPLFSSFRWEAARLGDGLTAIFQKWSKETFTRLEELNYTLQGPTLYRTNG